MITLNVIGPGRLGQSVARLAVDSGLYQIGGVLVRSASSAAKALDFIGAGQVCLQLTDFPAADLWLLAVPDSSISEVAQQLATAKVVKPGDVVFHASGALEAKILAPLQVQGAHIASLHPAFSFADPARAVVTFAGTPCAIEGDVAACDVLQQFALDIGGVPFALAEGGKVAYHAALSMAANYLVTLADLSLQTANQAGIAPETANRLVLGLMQQTLSNVQVLSPASALTGPIVRGDAATVAQHLSVLPESHQAAYRAMGEATVALAGERLSEIQRTSLMTTLQVSSPI
ncbi:MULTISPECIES: Rossmann-like and DUF2520 domain-containing protein [Deefgea]|uniref:DUF2520 domain-containing protein n=1 Tax=Deefgea chitinilytica TaxID=570276 RepID=A0ABS2C7M5_9NEIS|nr:MULTISPECIES: Rossmann-like and DUF2520 domain-containing protein [Deefgea]MBM5570167.1 DUF2520 domain-containing protein [Deefgea chitinilytica]MBM9887396.1 DUF2520 domain-containing protein [Deefgea sp. CFH1-16]